MWMEFIEDFWYTVLTVRNQFFDKFNLLTILKLDAKAFQNHIFWKSVKNKNTSNEWTITYKVVETRKGMTKTGTKNK